jgi:alpha-beta hydrolase superfamily lysophospholipase
MATIKSRDGLDLFFHHWKPKGTARGKVVLVHGYLEHSGRYEELGGVLTAAGFEVLAYDQRGHGRSGGRRSYIDRFSQYLDDLDLMLAEAERLVPGVPAFLLGHSLGGLVVTMHVLDRRPKIAGVVLSSPLFRVKVKVAAWKLLAGQIASRIYPAFSEPANLDALVARDPEIARRYADDPLNNKKANARWFTESNLAQERVFNEASAFEVPLLLMHGEGDTVADPVRSAEVFPRFGSTDKTLELISGAYHEIFNEPPADRRRIMERVVKWLDAHLHVQATGAAASP